jgi:hypothetical protein
MARRRGHLRRILCALLPLALLAPLCLSFGDLEGHYCACGMKRGECSCDLVMHRMNPGGGPGGPGGHCGAKMAVGSRCALRTPRPVKSDVPQVTLDLRHRLGVFEFHGFGFGLDPHGAVETANLFNPLSFASPPEPPPPRTSFPLS